MTEQEKYIAGQKASGIKVGDTVRVTRKAGTCEDGWATFWPPASDDIVGHTRVVDEVDNAGALGVHLTNECWFPYFVLEIVKNAGTVPGKQSHKQERNSNMSAPEQIVYDVTIVERTEKLHEASGIVQAINRAVLFDGKVSAVGNIAAQQKALEVCKVTGVKKEGTPLGFDKLEITCKPF